MRKFELYLEQAMKMLIDDGYDKGLFTRQSNDLSSKELITTYNFIIRNHNVLNGVIHKYNYFFNKCIVVLN